MEIDSVQYANITREMLINKSFLQIFDQGKDYLDKPPLLFWLSATSMYLFGINDIAFRLPSILMALIAIYSTYKFTLLYYTKEIALIAALVLASSQAMFLITHDVRADTMLMGWVILSIWQFSKWLQYKNWGTFILAFMAVAFGMMTKGPIALMVPVFSFVPHFFIHKNFKLLFRWEYLIGLVIIVVLLLPMDIGLYQQFDLHPEKLMYGKTGTSGLRFFYWTQSFGRITGESVWHENDHFTFLFENLLWGFLPWIFFFIVGLILEGYKLIKNKFTMGEQEEWISTPGFIITYCALGISHYQLPHYIYVVLPFASVIAAKYIYSIMINKAYGRLKNILSYLTILICTIVLSLLVFLLLIPFPNNKILSITTLLISLFVFLYFLFRKNINMPRSIQYALFSILVTNLLLNVFFYPKLLEYQLGNKLSSFISKNKISKSTFNLYHVYNERSLDFYSNYSFHSIDKLKELKTTDYLLVEKKLLSPAMLNEFDSVELISSFHVSTLNAKFLNPRTRDSAMNYHYILRKK
jgi:4-amino-4-deoxy-L-arabinose transferase-like glycosyltransferase